MGYLTIRLTILNTTTNVTQLHHIHLVQSRKTINKGLSPCSQAGRGLDNPTALAVELVAHAVKGRQLVVELLMLAFCVRWDSALERRRSFSVEAEVE